MIKQLLATTIAMMQQRLRHVGVAVLAVIIAGAIALPAQAQTNPSELAKAVESIEQLDALRSGLASTIDSSEEPTMQTMKDVCKPVGMQAMKLSQDNGWQVKQIANKYRNPAHAPDNLHSRMALAEFDQNPELVGFWERETLNGQEGTRYYRRINIEASCLACHGAEDSRPQFVKENYPQDRAYDFNVGDLRGMYAVFLPDVQAAINDSLQ